LFDQIDRAYLGLSSIFDKIKETDFVFAFFPCTRFEDQIQLHFRGTSFQIKKYSEESKLQYDLFLHKQLSDLYERVTKLAIICLRIGVPLVIENPYSTTHYLTKYWAIPATIIDKNRRDNGDYYQKPTQYWFIGCEPKYNLVLEPLEYVERKISNQVHGKGGSGQPRDILRSEIHPQYAERFIKQYIAHQDENGEWKL